MKCNRFSIRILRWFDRILRAFVQKPRAETQEDIRRREHLEQAGVEVIPFEASVPYGVVDRKMRPEIEGNVKFNLYKSKDRALLERLELPPIKDGIFVINTGEFCAGTDVQYAALRGVTKEKNPKS